MCRANCETRLSPLARAAWAKYDRDTNDRSWPLFAHLADTAAVARQLFDTWYSPAQRRLLTEVFGSTALARALAVWLAAVHDIGKATSVFAMKSPHGRTVMEDAGFVFPSPDPPSHAQRAYPHGYAGQLILTRALRTRNPDPDSEAVDRLAQIVGGHHGSFPQVSLNPEVTHLIHTEHDSWKTARTELLTRADRISGLTDPDWQQILAARIPDTAQALLNGYLIVCDWIASNEQHFPYETVPERADPDRRARDALDLLGFGPHWTPEFPASIGEYFSRRFGITEPHQAQRDAVALALQQEAPCLLLIEAPTGGGKTETALACAEIFAEKFGLHGAMIALPTRATTNAMFTRVLTWLYGGDVTDIPLSVSLAHSKAQFDEEFQKLSRLGTSASSIYDDQHSRDRAAVVVNEWMLGKKKSVFADFVISTIDQVLFAALKAKHLPLRHLGLTAKAVIIDEVHAADEFMMTYLLRVLQWLGAYGVPVIALSATLPPAQRARLLHAYREGARRRHRDSCPISQGSSWDTDITACAENDAYPLVTAVAAGAPQQIAPARSEKHAVYTVSTVADEDLVEAVLSEAIEGGCIAVVLNTMDRAQRVFEEIRNRNSGETLLLHSRFSLDARNRRERDLVIRLGPDTTERPSSMVVVATQVIESSLDVDFDLMFTDIAPSDLLIQRMGRVHRHARSPEARPISMRRPRIVLTGGAALLNGSTPPTFVSGSHSVYGEALLLRTCASLQELFTSRDSFELHVPADVPSLVRATYQEGALPPLGWEDSWQRAETQHLLSLTEQHQRSQQFVIPPPGMLGIAAWSALAHHEASEEQRTAAQVRDAEPALEVVLVREHGTGIYPLPGLPNGLSAEQINLQGISEHTARAVATTTVTLPTWLTRGSAMDRVLDELEADGIESWQSSHWLRGMLPLVLDEHLSATVGGHSVRYDHALGLIVERKERDDTLSFS